MQKYRFKTVKEMIENIDQERQEFLSTFILNNVIDSSDFNEFNNKEQLDEVLTFLEEREDEYEELYDNKFKGLDGYIDFYENCFDCYNHLCDLCDETEELMKDIEK